MTICTDCMGLGAHLARLDSLQVFPAAATKVLQVARAPNSSLVDMEKAVSSDPVLAGRVLKLANSPIYGLRTRVASLDRAISVLGFAGTRDVAVSLAIGGIGSDRTPFGRLLWRHALATAWAAKLLSRHARGVDAESAFVTGLLHDVGLQLLLVLRGPQLEEILAAESTEGENLLAREKAAFGTNHAELGAACLRRWGLPMAVADAVEPHHELDIARVPGVARPKDVALLQVADILAEGVCGAVSVDTLVQRVLASPASRVLRSVRASYEVAAETLIANRDALDQM